MTGPAPAAGSGRATADPAARRPVGGGWIASFGAMYLVQNLAWAAPSQLLLAQQILAWYPGEKEQRLAALMAVGGVASLMGHPLAGWLSDHTGGRFGLRAPWVLGGALVAAAALLALAAAPVFGVLVAGWAVFQLVIAASINAAQAIPPDTVPDRQYGIVSGVMGLTYTLGLFRGDAYHDYRWVFAARFLVTAGNYVALFYLFYYLRDRIGVADPDGGVLALTGVYALCVVVTAMASGRASDRSGRRRVYVALSSVGVAVACVLMAFAESFAAVVAAAVILGLSWGVYMAVDQALINEVLPDADTRGRDVGVMNLAVAGPNALAPVLAAASLAWLGGYPGLYVFSAAITAVGAVIIRQVRAVP